MRNAISKRAMLAAGLTAMLVAGCAPVETRPETGSAATMQPVSPTAPATPAPAFQWLYGSAEAAAASLQAFRALSSYAVERSMKRPADSVVVDRGGPLTAEPGVRIRYVPCAGKPAAVVFDADETLILNAGYAYWQSRTGRAFDTETWDEWERTGAQQVVAAPGAIEAVARLRAADIVPIVVTNRNAAHAAITVQALDKAGLGRFEHGKTLFLRGDDATGSDKDERRQKIAERFCVVAMAGDNLGDFADAYNRRGMPVDQRRAMVTGIGVEGGVSHLWGNGWFVLPNPTYGPSIAGDADTIFPAELRWSPKEDDK